VIYLSQSLGEKKDKMNGYTTHAPNPGLLIIHFSSLTPPPPMSFNPPNLHPSFLKMDARAGVAPAARPFGHVMNGGNYL